MEVNELKQSLIEQKANLQLFLDTLIKQRRAIIENNVQLLEESIAAEERLLSRIHNLEQSSKEAIKTLVRTYGLKVQNYSLSMLLKAAAAKSEIKLDDLLELKENIQILVNEISRANEHNRILVNHARSFVRETINALVNDKNAPLLDRKF